MVDRVELIRAASSAVRFSAAAGVKFNGYLDKALAMLLTQLELADARAMSEAQKDELEGAMREILLRPDLKKLSERWEKRKIDASETKTELSDALAGLLRERRAPYLPITVGLAEAKGLDDVRKRDLVSKIERLSPAGDLKTLVKRWDKHNKPDASVQRAWYAQTALALLDGTQQPVAAPPSVKKKR